MSIFRDSYMKYQPQIMTASLIFSLLLLMDLEVQEKLCKTRWVSHNHVNDEVDIEPNQCITSYIINAVVDKSKKRKHEEVSNDEDTHEVNCPPISAY